MKLGDIVGANLNVSSFIRIYLDPECSQWDDQLQGQTALVLGFHKNKHNQKIVEVLLPRGVRWVHQMDVFPL